MPLNDLHKAKKSKNLAVLAAILGFVAVIFFVSLIRMKGG
jgi:hypothetical protein